MTTLNEVQPLVSLLMTVYNREKYLSTAVESVLAQDYENWELIIVDDRSNDGSLEIAQSFEKGDERIRVYQNSENIGDYPNRNKAASYAKGKYLKYIDADDILYPHGLMVMVRSIEKFPEAAIACCRPDKDIIPMPYCLTPEEAFKEHFFKAHLFSNSPLGVIMKRSAFEEIGGFSGKRYVGDFEMWMEFALRYPVVKMVPGLAFWRSHGEQEVVKGKTSYQYPVMIDALVKDILSRDNLAFSEDERKQAWQIHRKASVKTIIRLFLARKFKQAVALMKAHRIPFIELLVNLR